MLTRVRNLEDRYIGFSSANEQLMRDVAAMRERVGEGLDSAVSSANRTQATLQPQIDRLRQSVEELGPQVCTCICVLCFD